MSLRSSELLIDDIWEALQKIGRYTDGMDHNDFVHDEKTVDSVVRNLEVIGEAANRLPEDFKSQHEDINWQGIIGLRNRIVQGYFSVDLEIIWQILLKDLPLFKNQLCLIRVDLCD